MNDAAPGNSADGPGGAFSLNSLTQGMKVSDIAFAVGLVLILLMLIVPMPGWLLDIALAFSVTFSVMVLMTAVFTQKPLQFSSFPTVLLIATMLRLSLNLASTRLILADGHTGTDAAGQVIKAFGQFLMGDEVVIGIIVFAILIIVNFMVITKGSGRIAEVAARFSLDAMPGKQMAIDADMSAGIIDETEARTRRKELEDESSFFGSMDGASKFVRGDAIAGLLITLINIVAGIFIGVVQKDMQFADAVNNYTILTIGDGLVSQIPALIVSTAAGLLVTKAGLEGATDKALFSQMTHYPRAIGVGSALLTSMSFMPGIPFIPFAMMGGTLGYIAYSTSQRSKKDVLQKKEEKAAADVKAQPSEEPISSALAIDQLRLELGYGLLSLINDSQGSRLTDQIKSLRRQLASELGVVMPSVRILDNMQLPPNVYVVRIKETEMGRGEVRPGMFLVMDPKGQPVQIPGEPTTEPAFGLPATWVDQSAKEEATFRGYTVVDAATVVTTHLTEMLKDNLSELLSYAETQKLLDELSSEHQKLVGDVIPAQISISGVQRVLQILLRERVSIRDLPTILEGIAEASALTQSSLQITEHVRSRLSRQLSAAYAAPEGSIPLVSLSPEWEQAFAENLIGQGDEKQLAMSPSKLQDFINSIRSTFDQQAARGENPVLLTSPMVRPYARSIVERFRPATVIMSQNEIHPQAKIKTLGQI